MSLSDLSLNTVRIERDREREREFSYLLPLHIRHHNRATKLLNVCCHTRISSKKQHTCRHCYSYTHFLLHHHLCLLIIVTFKKYTTAVTGLTSKDNVLTLPTSHSYKLFLLPRSSLKYMDEDNTLVLIFSVCIPNSSLFSRAFADICRRNLEREKPSEKQRLLFGSFL